MRSSIAFGLILNDAILKSSIKEFTGILKPYDLDFVAVQEINSFDNWSKFCNLLGLENIVFDPSESDSFVQDNIDILMGDMNSLTRDDYSDNYYQTNILELHAFRQTNSGLKDEKVATCQFATRIDYIYVRLRVNDSWILEEYFIIGTKNSTDHNAVFAAFKLVENS
ncbi:unnamed protein product [Rotaria magnacalcarata]|uniref:Endonuclease/exonuclease/phosphatase domain-containing protein n=1 Tax=Rotaria magnacalcarata TaxID=392030 RepID=A0A8S2NUT6_9BILA|nr:unnamed protein product [Rotaria magnacalcarata]